MVVLMISLGAYQEPALRIRFDVTDEPKVWCAGVRKRQRPKRESIMGRGGEGRVCRAMKVFGASNVDVERLFVDAPSLARCRSVSSFVGRGWAKRR